MTDIAYTLFILGVLFGAGVVLLTIGALLPIAATAAIWVLARQSALALWERVAK